MKSLMTVLAGLLFFISCKEEKKETGRKFISVVSLIKEQVAHIDTSLYTIIKLDIKDSLHTDTTYIPREEFAATAKDFLTIPDLSDKKVAKRFKEEVLFDPAINRASVTYTPVDPKNEEVQIQQLSVSPLAGPNDNVKSIYIRREIENRDSSVQKTMFWQMSKSFTITTITQKPAQPRITTKTEVRWSEGGFQ